MGSICTEWHVSAIMLMFFVTAMTGCPGDGTHFDLRRVMSGGLAFSAVILAEPKINDLYFCWIDSEEFRFINASSYYGKVVVDSFSVSGVIRGQRLVGFGSLLR